MPASQSGAECAEARLPDGKLKSGTFLWLHFEKIDSALAVKKSWENSKQQPAWRGCSVVVLKLFKSDISLGHKRS